MSAVLSKLKNRWVIIGFVVGTLIVSVLGGVLGESFGLGFIAGSLPEVSIFPELIVKIGSYSLLNTTITLWLTGLVLLILALVVRLKIKEVPGPLQTAFEVVIEFFENMAKNIGGPQAKRFVPFVVLLFLVILTSNWLGIFPLAGPVGRLETAGEYIEHHAEAEHTKISEKLVESGFTDYSEKEVHILGLVYVLDHDADKTFTAFDGESVAILPFGRGQESKVRMDQIVPVSSADLNTLNDEIYSGVKVDNLSENSLSVMHDIEHYVEISQVQNIDGVRKGEEVIGKSAGILIPYLRGASTDIYTTLSMAIVGMIMVQYFGFSALGFRGYAGKFLNFGIFRLEGGLFNSFIRSFIGLLELIGEFARTVSFAFRLFGNMFAGEVLLFTMSVLVPLIGLVPFLGLELFVGVLQAYIFASLILVFSYMAVQSHGEEH